jgi:hypothetical protein
MKKLKNKIFILLLLTVASLGGCCPGPVPLESPPPPALFLDHTAYPETFRTIHRCTLSIGSRTFVFNGYLKVDRALNTIKCVAQTDMGATMFKYVYQDGNLNILYCTPGFKPDWIKKYALRDATLVCLPRSSTRLSRGARQESLLTDTRLTRYRIRKHDTEIYTATFTYFKDDLQDGCPGDLAIPKTITIIDKSLDYRLDIRVVDFRCIPENDS